MLNLLIALSLFCHGTATFAASKKTTTQKKIESVEKKEDETANEEATGSDVNTGAEEKEKSEPKPEKTHGIYATLLGDPGINLIGINFGEKITPRLRADIGLGTIIFANTLGASIRYYTPLNDRAKLFFGTGLNRITLTEFDNSHFYGNVDKKSLIYQTFFGGFEIAGNEGFFFSAHLAGFYFYSGDPEKLFFFNVIPALALGIYF